MTFENVLAAARPRVLVLLATYNGAKWIDEQLTSILAQEDIDVEVRISDDRSSDTTAEIIQSGYGHDTRVHLTVSDRSSGSAGANFRRMFRQVSADGFSYVALADQDDIWHPHKMKTAVEAMARSHADGYSCAVQSFWEDGREKTLRQNPNMRPADYLFEGGGQGCTFVIKKALFDGVQQVCSKHEETVETLHYHDWLIYLFARVQGSAWYFDENPWMRYRQHGGNEIGSRGGGLASIYRRLDLIRSGWFRGQVKAALRVGSLMQRPTALIDRFAHRFNTGDSVFRRIWMLAFVVRNGRRRLTDRLVLGISAVCGWI